LTSLSIVIPAYNESKRLPLALETLSHLNAESKLEEVILTEILVIDDGSKDNTIQVANGFKKYGYDVMIGTNDSSKHEDLKAKTNGKIAVGTFEETARFGDLLVLAVKGSGAESVLGMAAPDVILPSSVSWVCVVKITPAAAVSREAGRYGMGLPMTLSACEAAPLRLMIRPMVSPVVPDATGVFTHSLLTRPVVTGEVFEA